MRKLTAILFISLDMIADSPDQWQETFDDDMLADMQTRIDSSDAIVLGRVTYDYWMPYWPTATHEPFATFINTTPKYVASRTLDKVEWGGNNNIALLKGDLAAAIIELKQQSGKNISVEASPTLTLELLNNDLLDELKLMIHPVIAGRGERFFKDRTELKRLKLLENKTTRSGTIIATYQPLKKG